MPAFASFAALPPGGRIYLHEVLLDDAKDGPLTPASFALAMTYFNGRGGEFQVRLSLPGRGESNG